MHELKRLEQKKRQHEGTNRAAEQQEGLRRQERGALGLEGAPAAGVLETRVAARTKRVDLRKNRPESRLLRLPSDQLT